MSSVARLHGEWLSLLEINGPFLSIPVLLKAFPQGLEAHDPDHAQLLRTYYDEWLENQESNRPDAAIHRAWINFVLKETLGFTDDVLLTGQQIPETLSVFVALENETLRPDFVLVNPAGSAESGTPRLLIQILPISQGVEKSMESHRWKASPASRMLELLKATNTRVGLVTNGEQWMLVNAPQGESTGYITWTADLWVDEPTTLQAFRSLLALRRFFGVDPSETLELLLNESLADQQEVTDQLGYQVRKAVEVFIQAFDRIDQDRNRELLRGVSATFLYEAALTVMMRLVFLLSAEERGLFMLGEEMYDQYYAVSTLRAQLRETADQQGEEVLSRRSDAWCRLLATFRAVYGGVEHDALRLPAYGGSLFDPDRFPFLEGRPTGTNWRDKTADPLPISNQIVLHLLEALQILRVKVPGGPPEPRRLSFSALGVEQIGHVYEGLLDHTAVRAVSPVLGLTGSKDQESELSLEELERLKERGDKDLFEYLKKVTGRQASTIKRALDAGAEEQVLDDHLETQRLLQACDNDAALCDRVRPWAKLLRRDSMDFPVVINAGSLYVTSGDDRRSTGTHYTPPALTEPIVKHTLDPLVYVGPAEGAPETEWKLKSAKEILGLKICDVAMGSGAFLVQACRYLAEKLVEAWEDAEAKNPRAFIVTPEGDLSNGSEQERLLPADVDERILIARRYIADKCLYGVDRNQLAVEMAKLSLWLVTLRRDRPFTFLDHAFKCGDSLLGVTSFKQLEGFELDPAGGIQIRLIAAICRPLLAEAAAKRHELESFTADTAEDVQRKEALFHKAEGATDKVQFIADLLVGEALTAASKRKKTWARTAQEAEEAQNDALGELDEGHESLEELVTEAIAEWNKVDLSTDSRIADLRERAARLLGERRPFHWVLEFPEVFASGNDLIIRASPSPNIVARSYQDEYTHSVWIGEESQPDKRKRISSRPIGFDAIVGNPPFIGGKKISGALGTEYRDYLIEHLANGKRGNADLVAYFFLRVKSLLKHGGHFGLVATNTVAQGDTREVGLDQITTDGGMIYRAVASRPWAGTAALEVAHVWFRNDNHWKNDCVLDEQRVSGITPLLMATSGVSGNPYRLAANADKSFVGSYVLGMGFVLTCEEATSLIEKDPRNHDVLYPYLNGEDVNSRFDQSPSRWVINFFDYPLERVRKADWSRLSEEEREKAEKSGLVGSDYDRPVAADYPDCLSIVVDRVKPERTRRNKEGEFVLRKPLPIRWWMYADKRPFLYSIIKGMSRVLVIPETTKFCTFSFCDTNVVFSHMTKLITLAGAADYCLLNSSIHEIWGRKYSSTLETRLKYMTSDAFETFPFPASTANLEAIGTSYDVHRRSVMLAREEGVTKTYNRFHLPSETGGDIQRLRELHVQMDTAVVEAYGWFDLKLGHDFYQTKQGVRFSINELTRREVLDRLLQLNHERYAEEVRLGLHDKKRGTVRRKKKSLADAMPLESKLVKPRLFE